MIAPIDIKKGTVVKLDGELYNCTFSQFVNPGKGSAFVRTKLKNIKTGKVLDRTFKSSETIEDVEMDKRYVTFLYKEDDDHFVFMDKDDFEQFTVPASLIEEYIPFMKEEIPFEINFYEGDPVSVTPPNFVDLEVTYAEDAIKGDTIGSSKKRIEVETGGEVMVPLHIKQGDIIRVDLRDLSFSERVNK